MELIHPDTQPGKPPQSPFTPYHYGIDTVFWFRVQGDIRRLFTPYHYGIETNPTGPLGGQYSFLCNTLPLWD